MKFEVLFIRSSKVIKKEIITASDYDDAYDLAVDIAMGMYNENPLRTISEIMDEESMDFEEAELEYEMEALDTIEIVFEYDEDKDLYNFDDDEEEYEDWYVDE